MKGISGPRRLAGLVPEILQALARPEIEACLSR